MDDFGLASALFGTKRAEGGSDGETLTMFGQAVGDSSDGMVEVALGDDVVADGEEWDDDGNQLDPGAGATVMVPTEAAVREGDSVTVTLTGGTAKEPMVSGVRGGGDRMQAEIDAASAAATEAQAVAGATGQHFWDDGSGAHVTERTREEWGEDPSGHNILMNSLGILLRKALAPLVSVTESAVAFFDGLGDSAGNVVARFGRDGATVGRADDVHVAIDTNSFDVADGGGNVMFSSGVANDEATGKHTMHARMDYRGTRIILQVPSATIESVVDVNDVNGTSSAVPASAYAVEDTWLFTLVPPYYIEEGHHLDITYSTTAPIPYLTSGKRVPGSEVGPRSAVIGYGEARGHSSLVQGMSSSGKALAATNHAATALGAGNRALNVGSCALGVETRSSGRASLSSGTRTEAVGNSSFAGGVDSSANGTGSIAFGVGCIAGERDAITEREGGVALGKGLYAGTGVALGAYNLHDEGNVLEVGCGTSDSDCRNALAIGRDGRQVNNGYTVAPYCYMRDYSHPSFRTNAARPASDYWGSVIGQRGGSDNDLIALDQVAHRADGNVERYSACRRYSADGSSFYQNGVRYIVSESGKPYIRLVGDTSAEWRGAIGATAKRAVSFAFIPYTSAASPTTDFAVKECKVSVGNAANGVVKTASVAVPGYKALGVVGQYSDHGFMWKINCSMASATSVRVEVTGNSSGYVYPAVLYVNNNIINQ